MDEPAVKVIRCLHEGCFREVIDPELELCTEHIGEIEKQKKSRWSVKKIQAYIKFVKIPREKYKNSGRGFADMIMEEMNS